MTENASWEGGWFRRTRKRPKGGPSFRSQGGDEVGLRDDSKGRQMLRWLELEILIGSEMHLDRWVAEKN